MKGFIKNNQTGRETSFTDGVIAGPYFRAAITTPAFITGAVGDGTVTVTSDGRTFRVNLPGRLIDGTRYEFNL